MTASPPSTKGEAKSNSNFCEAFFSIWISFVGVTFRHSFVHTHWYIYCLVCLENDARRFFESMVPTNPSKTNNQTHSISLNLSAFVFFAHVSSFANPIYRSNRFVRWFYDYEVENVYTCSLFNFYTFPFASASVPFRSVPSIFLKSWLYFIKRLPPHVFVNTSVSWANSR